MSIIIQAIDSISYLPQDLKIRTMRSIIYSSSILTLKLQLGGS